MKITAVKGYPVMCGHRNIFIVKIETDSGIYGIGEGGMSGRELAMQGHLEHVAAFLVGMDPRRIEHIWQVIYRSFYFEGGNIMGAVISAIDMALWDILGKHLNTPVYQLLGGACRERVDAFATPGTLNGPEIVEKAKQHVADGWRYLRFGPGMPDEGWTGGMNAVYEPMESIELSVHWIREVRKAVGPGIGLSIDFHHRLSVAEAALFCQQVEDIHLMFLEEPIRAENPKAYQQLRSMTNMPFAIGEEFPNKWVFAPYIEEGIMNFCRIDISNVGGFSEAKKVSGWCETHYIDVMPHNPLGPVTTAASVHFALAISNFAQLEYQAGIAAGYPKDLFPVQVEINGTSYDVPTRPGLGVEFDEDAVKNHPFVNWEAPRWHRRDGSHTNW